MAFDLSGIDRLLRSENAISNKRLMREINQASGQAAAGERRQMVARPVDRYFPGSCHEAA
jgi:hypothetical protein